MFVFAPVDTVTTREEIHPAVRDNVIFEVGIFMGELGIDRTFVVEVETGTISSTIANGSGRTRASPSLIVNYRRRTREEDRAHNVYDRGTRSVTCNFT